VRDRERIFKGREIERWRVSFECEFFRWIKSTGVYMNIIILLYLLDLTFINV
jgi:hypothetical protein